MSTEQRMERASLLDQRVGTGDRGRGERTPTYRGEMLHYRDDYGASMDDPTYEAWNADQESFSTNVGDAKSTLASSRTDVEDAYSTQKGEIDSQTSGIAGYSGGTKEEAFNDWWSTDTAPVRIVNGNTVEDVYNMPKSVISDLGNSFNQGDGSFVANWVDDGKYYNIDVTPQGGSDSYGKELRESIAGMEQQARDSFYSSGSYENAVDSYNNQASQAQGAFDTSKASAYSVLNSEYSTAQERLDSQQSQIDAAIAANKGKLNTVRNRYSTKLANVKKTIQDLFGDN